MILASAAFVNFWYSSCLDYALMTSYKGVGRNDRFMTGLGIDQRVPFLAATNQTGIRELIASE